MSYTAFPNRISFTNIMLNRKRLNSKQYLYAILFTWVQKHPKLKLKHLRSQGSDYLWGGKREKGLWGDSRGDGICIFLLWVMAVWRAHLMTIHWTIWLYSTIFYRCVTLPWRSRNLFSNKQVKRYGAILICIQQQKLMFLLCKTVMITLIWFENPVNTSSGARNFILKSSAYFL